MLLYKDHIGQVRAMYTVAPHRGQHYCGQLATVCGGQCHGASIIACRGGNEATDTQLPYDPRDTGHRSQLEPVLNVALSSPRWAIECFIGWFSP